MLDAHTRRRRSGLARRVGRWLASDSPRALAVAATVWAADVEIGREGVHRIDAATGRDSGVVGQRGIYALATGGDSLWAVTGNGTVLRLDGRTGAVRRRWPALAL